MNYCPSLQAKRNESSKMVKIDSCAELMAMDKPQVSFGHLSKTLILELSCLFFCGHLFETGDFENFHFFFLLVETGANCRNF